MIKPETIQEIFETAKIDEVVGDFVSLKRRGINLIGLCPFHNEKTPSFTVSPAKGIYKCFGCGKGGNAVNFIMDHEHYTYPEALKYLAHKYSVEIDEEEQTPEMIQQHSSMEGLFHVSAFAQKYFSETLNNTEEGKAIGLSYFLERDFTEETILKFQLGYCLDKFDDFSKTALKEGYKKEQLIKSGLSIENDQNIFDRFKARVIFPIHNLTGRVVGFGGRILSSEKSKAKYVNSPESDIYNKSKVLYGIFYAKNAILKNDDCLLVEGYTDVISLHQAGIENVVASSGTSLTIDQIKLIKRFTPNITILYDGDAAGLKASFRGIDMILEAGMNVKIVLFPDGEDPDSFARNHSRDEVKDFIKKNAADFISFKTNLLVRESDKDPLKKAALIKEIVQTIALIPDGIYRSVYVKECSSIMDIAEQTLVNELNKLLRKKFKDQNKEAYTEQIPQYAVPDLKEKLEVEQSDTLTHEREIIRLLLTYADQEIIFEDIDENDHKIEVPIKIAEYVIHDLKSDEIDFHDAGLQLIFNEFDRALENGTILTSEHFTQNPDAKLSKLAIDLMATPYELSDNWLRKRIPVKHESDNLIKLITSCVLSFKAKKIDQMILDNQKELNDIDDPTEFMLRQQKHMSLKTISIEINKQLSRIITK
ncbi:MAG: DNA primase [Bacteroidetes bacterium HGW-Bacteroidetes-17]|nr:MAG: DNA primase [Bacteroidetes bacterium HGW-Bacteroidetes-17]